jgi:hypothetical protein
MITLEQRISSNADALISLGKAAWLKKRKAAYKQNMSDEQQEAELLEIERRREEQGIWKAGNP